MKVFKMCITLVFVLCVVVSGAYAADDFVSKRISNTANAELGVSLYDGKIAFSSDADGDYDIYLWDGSTTTQITDNTAGDYDPSLYDGKIAWDS